MLKTHNSEMTEEMIRKLSHEELVQAVLRMVNVEPVNAQDWLGKVYVADQLADAFRGRLI
jgi:hypothetical protein